MSWSRKCQRHNVVDNMCLTEPDVDPMDASDAVQEILIELSNHNERSEWGHCILILCSIDGESSPTVRELYSVTFGQLSPSVM